MNTLYIVSCGNQTRKVRLPAAQLYIGAKWNAAITHARHFAEKEQDVRILSAKHGLLFQGQLLDPYDARQNQIENRDQLIAAIRRELPREAGLPLRIVMLTSTHDTELFRAACLGTRFEKVPLRAPLKELSEAEGVRWMHTVTGLVECNAQLPTLERLDSVENRHLQEASRRAAMWWSRQLMRDCPPPDPSLFADALALELVRAWDECYALSRGEWPEDIRLSIEFQFKNAPTGSLATALEAIGIDPVLWWKREWRDRRLAAQMSFSLENVRVQIGDGQQIVWEKAPLSEL